MSGSLIIISGPPGAGKSTVASLIANSFDRSVLIEGDAFFGFLAAGGIDPWLPESRTQNAAVTEAAAAATSRFVSAGYQAVYDGVLGPWLIDGFIAAGQLTVVDYTIVLPSVEVCLQRVTTRQGHAFTDEAATRKMHHEFMNAAIPRRHLCSNDGPDPSTTANGILAARARGELRYIGPA